MMTTKQGWLMGATATFALATLLVLTGRPAAKEAAEKVIKEAAFRSVPPRPHHQPGFTTNPYDAQVAEQIKKLDSAMPAVRAGAAEALAYLRADSAADALVRALDDDEEIVRREAAMALAWCGRRAEASALLAALDDEDWVVRQAAWVALTNITGMEWPFDALAEESKRTEQSDAWRMWWAGVPEDAPPDEILQLVAGDDLEGRLRAVRALGALGGRGATDVLVNLVTPYRDVDYSELELRSIQKAIVQSTLRSLGRLRDPQALPVLLEFLDTRGWARYAADALGDFGDSQAVAPLLAAYPKFARQLNNRMGTPRIYPRDDRAAGDNTQDRMYETPYAIAVALARLPLDDSAHLASLHKIGPLFVANLPSDFDGGVFYEIESFQLVTAYLLEKVDLRQAACDAAFRSAAESDKWIQHRRRSFHTEGLTEQQALAELSIRMMRDVPHMAAWLPALCRQNDVPRLIELLEHENGWIRINAAKALMFIGDRRAIEPLARHIAESHPEAEYGFSGVLEHDEYNDPGPRWREAYVRALGRLGAEEHTDLLVEILEDQRNVVDVQHAAALALDEMGTPAALAALGRMEVDHPFHSVQLVAREALWRHGITPQERPPISEPAAVPLGDPSYEAPTGEPEAYVFIKGEREMRSDFNGQAGVDPWRQTYTVNNSAPTMRLGRNLYILRRTADGPQVTQFTHFERGYVADCEVSWDGKRIIFARRLNDDHRNYDEVPYEEPRLREPGEFELDGPDDPWWHVWEINVDGTGLRQITHGPYHHVQPAYLPDGRIVMASTRLGLRDEYHGYLSTGLAVMNADGSDLHVIGFNLGADREPAVLADGRIVFGRLDVFYSRLKAEMTIQAVYPDGTRNVVLYGPERRGYWMGVHKKYAAWTMRESYAGSTDNRNRVVRVSQPQPMGDGRLVCASSGGLVLLGPGRNYETLIPHDRKFAVTSPFPIGGGKVVCAATIKQFDVDGRIVTCGTEEFEALEKGPELFRSAINIDHALYLVDAETGAMELLYNDPDSADFEARPIIARRRPIARAEGPETRKASYTARLFCDSARTSRDARVASRGRLVRVIEGQPLLGRHEGQNNINGDDSNRWKNHGGTHARVLGTVPLAADGSFYIEVPADRLLHLQVLDADRRVVGNQLFWMYARPGETRSCVGCHEQPDTVIAPNHFALAAKMAPVKTLPTGGEFSYRAKAWIKGVLSDEEEERTRTVHAISLIGRQ